MARITHGDVRTRILDAARDRMRHYGFKKTTIDEIAADAGVGKGTVYLYFESKEDVALALMAEFKERTISKMNEIAHNSEMTLTSKLTEMLLFPILEVQNTCKHNPGSLDMILAVRPHIQMRLRPYLEHETAVIAEVLEQGNQQGLLDVHDTMRAARALKLMVSGFWPPYPVVTEPETVEEQIGLIVEMAVRGMRKSATRENSLIS